LAKIPKFEKIKLAKIANFEKIKGKIGLPKGSKKKLI